jgi:hypothetical protein
MSATCPPNPVWSDVEQLFRPSDVTTMAGVSANWAPGPPYYGPLNLADYENVKAHATLLVAALITNQDMPCDGPWSQAYMDCFQNWVNAGCPQTAGPAAESGGANAMRSKFVTDAGSAANPVWADVAALFRPSDVTTMAGVSAGWAAGPPYYGPLNLADYGNVKAHATILVAALITNQDMPCDGPWSQAYMDTFQNWVNAGCPES